MHIAPDHDKRAKIRHKYPERNLATIALRLVKNQAGGESYIIGTTLIDSTTYPIEHLSDVYHAQWGVEELYKISKQLIKVEQFHAHSERGVKQELFAHFVLITLTRRFANHTEDGFNANRNANEHAVRANFKNCLSTMSRQLEALLLKQANLLTKTLSTIIASIRTSRQKLRPNRSYPRCSRAPVGKWLATKMCEQPMAMKAQTA